MLAPQRACRPVRVQVGGCAEVFRNFYEVDKYYGSPSKDLNQKMMETHHMMESRHMIESHHIII